MNRSTIPKDIKEGTDQSKVTVVLATYNGEKFLEEQLESIRHQTLQPDVLIVSDDCSTDNTIQIVREFASSASFPVKIRINPVRMGYAVNFLSALEMVKTKYVAFCDQDDIWYPTKLETCLCVMREKGSFHVVHQAVLIDKDGRKGGLHFRKFGRDETGENQFPIPLNCYSGFASVFQSSIFSAISWSERGGSIIYDKLAVHDEWAEFLAGCLGPLSKISIPLASYRQHGGNASGSRRPALKIRIIAQFESPERHLRRQTIVARYRIDLISRLQSNQTDDIVLSRLDRASSRWTWIYEHSDLRVKVYGGRRLYQRLVAFHKMFVRGLYTGKSCDGGIIIPLKDLFIGVLGINKGRSIL